MRLPDAEAELRTDHLISDVGRRGVRGGALSFGAQAAKLVLQVATVIVLTRLLAPSAFGLIAMVAAINTVLDLVKELGLSAATIRKTDITHAQVTTLFWLNTAVGLAITLALVLSAPAIAAFYHQPSLIAVTRALSLSFAITGLSVQHWALLRRQMRFGAVLIVDVGGEIIGFCFAIVLALSGYGIWALVAQRISAPIYAAIACWIFCRWRPGAPRLADGARELFHFGAAVSGVNVVSSISRSIDQVLVGWVFGPAVLGLYDRASRLMIAPLNNFNPPLYAVAMPSFSRIAHQPDRYRRGFGEMLEKIAMMMMPGAALAAVCSDWVVKLLFGPHWSAATPLVACFAVAVAYQPLIQMAGLLYLTQNRAREMVRAALIDSTFSVVAVVAGLPFGAVGVAVSIAAIGMTIRLPAALWLASRKGSVRFGDLIAAIAPAAATALCVGVLAHLVRNATVGLPAPLAILATIGAGLGVCLATYAVFPRSRRALHSFGELVRMLNSGKTEGGSANQAALASASEPAR